MAQNAPGTLVTGNAKRFLKVAEKVNLRSKEFDFSLFLDSIVYFLLSGSKTNRNALCFWTLWSAFCCPGPKPTGILSAFGPYRAFFAIWVQNQQECSLLLDPMECFLLSGSKTNRNSLCFWTLWSAFCCPGPKTNYSVL